VKRLVLFDIDGTLLAGGPAKEAFQLALVEVFGTAGPIETWEFSGKTDPQIARELLREGGVGDAVIDERFPDLWTHYLSGLEARLPGNPTRALPGVVSLLEALRAEAGVALGLVTGNLARGAELKLGAARLDGPFPVGGFGSDHEERNELPGVALVRARDHWGRSFASHEVVVVGDTPRDVACGKAHGLRTVAVATGRFDAHTLAATGPDATLEDLEETEHVVRLLLDGRSGRNESRSRT
jgi:phosphoglycolate phosphatase